MSVWSWMLLVFLLPAAGSLDVENWLTPIVEIIRTEYNISRQFCVAVNIPVDQNPDQLLDVLQNDRYEKVEEVMKNNTDLYISTRVVAAKPHVEHAEVSVLPNMDGLYIGTSVVADKPHVEHAEVRVLSSMNDLFGQSRDNFLVFYTYLSPCALQCANPRYDRNILNGIRDITRRSYWGERHALVFGQPCTYLGDYEITREQLKKSFINLYKFGFTNIFRCYFRNVSATSVKYQCHSCFLDQNQRVSEVCLEGAESQQGGSAGSSQGVSTGGKRGSAEGTSSSAAAKRQKEPQSDHDMSISSSGGSSRSSSGGSSGSSSGGSSRSSSGGSSGSSSGGSSRSSSGGSSRSSSGGSSGSSSGGSSRSSSGGSSRG